MPYVALCQGNQDYDSFLKEVSQKVAGPLRFFLLCLNKRISTRKSISSSHSKQKPKIISWLNVSKKGLCGLLETKLI